MAEIRIPAHAVVLITGGRRAPFAELANLVPESVAAPWDVMKPDASLEALHAAMGVSRIVRVCMRSSNAKARRSVASAAHRRGMKCICLRLPGSEEVDAVGEKIDRMYDVASPEDTTFVVTPMPSDRTDMNGPFDIIGDVHGSHEQLIALLRELGHLDDEGRPRRHPGGRIVVLLGDLTDRGPQNRAVLETARAIEAAGGLVIRGNHDEKLRNWLLGKSIEIKAGLDVTVRELADTTTEWRHEMAAWIGTLEPHLMLAGGRLAVAHAGIDEEHQGRHTGGAFAFGLYGKPVEGGTVLDEHGFPAREDWALSYGGSATVVHGHVVHPFPRIVNDVVAIDTGCGFGGPLTAFRWPERRFVSIRNDLTRVDDMDGSGERT